MTTMRPDRSQPHPDPQDHIPALSCQHPGHEFTSSAALDGPAAAHRPASQPPLSSRRPAPGDPYCSNCGYLLKHLVDASRCPECGLPLVEVLVRERTTFAHKQRRFRTDSTMFGWPIIDLCIGLDDQGKFGRAKGVIAIGDVATGLIAVGNKWATGVVALGGGGAVGLCSIGGGCGIGLLTAVGGGIGIGGIGFGGCGAGGIATGGAAIGFVAQGGAAIGYYARGGGVVGVHTVGPGGPSSQRAADTFAALQPYIGHPASSLSMLTPVLLVAAFDVLLIGVLLTVAVVGHRRWKHRRALSIPPLA